MGAVKAVTLTSFRYFHKITIRESPQLALSDRPAGIAI
jgi:hypothetical protein